MSCRFLLRSGAYIIHIYIYINHYVSKRIAPTSFLSLFKSHSYHVVVSLSIRTGEKGVCCLTPNKVLKHVETSLRPWTLGRPGFQHPLIAPVSATVENCTDSHWLNPVTTCNCICMLAHAAPILLPALLFHLPGISVSTCGALRSYAI